MMGMIPSTDGHEWMYLIQVNGEAFVWCQHCGTVRHEHDDGTSYYIPGKGQQEDSHDGCMRITHETIEPSIYDNYYVKVIFVGFGCAMFGAAIDDLIGIRWILAVIGFVIGIWSGMRVYGKKS